MGPRIESLCNVRGDTCVYYDDKLIATVKEENGFWYAVYYTQGYKYNGEAELSSRKITESEAKELFALLL